MKIGIIDSKQAIYKALPTLSKRLEPRQKLFLHPSKLRASAIWVLPGQGEFGDCAEKLSCTGMLHTIRQWIAADQPFLGICVGYQLLFEGSDESPETAGLGIFKGRCQKFPQGALKVPHMGWNAVRPHPPGPPYLEGPRP